MTLVRRVVAWSRIGLTAAEFVFSAIAKLVGAKAAVGVAAWPRNLQLLGSVHRPPPESPA